MPFEAIWHLAMDYVSASTTIKAVFHVLTLLDVDFVLVQPRTMATAAGISNVEMLVVQMPSQVLFGFEICFAVGTYARPAWRVCTAVFCCDVLQSGLDVVQGSLTLATENETWLK